MLRMSLRGPSLVALPLSPRVYHHINDDRNGENQDVIGTGSDDCLLLLVAPALLLAYSVT